MPNLLTKKILFLVALTTCLGVLSLKAQVGGPYTVDDHTMLLLHFDGDLKNASPLTVNGEFHGDVSNFYFLNNSVANLSKCLRIDNDSQSDSAFVTVADAPSLDLTKDWTIEGWINIFTFGEGSDDWRWVPRLVIKTGDEVFWQPNYFVEMWGSTRFFSCGYHTASKDQWPQANSPDNTMVPGQWYHMAFIRDTQRHILLTIIHNANRELVAFTAADYLSFGAIDPTPITTNQPLHIGYAGGGTDSFLDGFVDEIRISDNIREFPIPPIITNVTQLPNQVSTTLVYEVGANVFTLFGSKIAKATLYYNAGTGWRSSAMTSVGADSMVGEIPQLPSGSIIRYYLKAVDSNGLTNTMPQSAEELETYYSFGIFTPRTQTLWVNFEEGSGIPKDASSYKHQVTLVGKPTFATNAAVGNYSIHLDGDSSYLEVDSPFLTMQEFCVDFWLNPDSIKDYCRILNRPRAPGTWAENNYQIRFDNAKHLQAISDGGVVSFTSTQQVELGKWYHVIYEMMMAPPGDSVPYYAAFQVRDKDNQIFYNAYAPVTNPVILATSPLRIGKAAGGTYPPYFEGYIDNVQLYNYPAMNLLKDIVGVANNPHTPLAFELSLNYPNPFNPTTEIQFTLPKFQKVNLTIFDVLGKQVKMLVDKKMEPGRYFISWDGTNDFGLPVSSGIYFYKLRGEDVVKVRKMTLLK